MSNAIILIICGMVMILCVKSIKNDLTSGPSELEMLSLQAAYLEGVKVWRSGEDYKGRWQELKKEFSR